MSLGQKNTSLEVYAQPTSITSIYEYSDPTNYRFYDQKDISTALGFRIKQDFTPYSSLRFGIAFANINYHDECYTSRGIDGGFSSPSPTTNCDYTYDEEHSIFRLSLMYGFQFFNREKFSIYALTGLSREYLHKLRAKTDLFDSTNRYPLKRKNQNGTFAHLGFGFDYRVYDFLKIFIEPNFAVDSQSRRKDYGVGLGLSFIVGGKNKS